MPQRKMLEGYKLFDVSLGQQELQLTMQRCSRDAGGIHTDMKKRGTKKQS